MKNAEFFQAITAHETQRGVRFIARAGFRDSRTGYIYYSEKKVCETPQTAESFCSAVSRKVLDVRTVHGEERQTDSKDTESRTKYFARIPSTVSTSSEGGE